jgi:hypothetical protein
MDPAKMLGATVTVTVVNKVRHEGGEYSVVSEVKAELERVSVGESLLNAHCSNTQRSITQRSITQDSIAQSSGAQALSRSSSQASNHVDESVVRQTAGSVGVHVDEPSDSSPQFLGAMSAADVVHSAAAVPVQPVPVTVVEKKRPSVATIWSATGLSYQPTSNCFKDDNGVLVSWEDAIRLCESIIA